MQSLRFYATGFNPATTTVINGKSGAATGLCCAAFDWGHLLDLRPVPRKAGPLRGCHSSWRQTQRQIRLLLFPVRKYPSVATDIGLNTMIARATGNVSSRSA